MVGIAWARDSELASALVGAAQLVGKAYGLVGCCHGVKSAAVR